jgi:putative membrane protein
MGAGDDPALPALTNFTLVLPQMGTDFILQSRNNLGEKTLLGGFQGNCKSKGFGSRLIYLPHPYICSSKEKIMALLANILTGLVALLHLGFLYLEMFLWDKPRGLRTFNLTPEAAKQSKTLAMNQGLYNGFLAAGLIWGLFAGEPVKIFFLSCVIIAGIFGALTVSKRIFYIQAVPAILALVLLLIF